MMHFGGLTGASESSTWIPTCSSLADPTGFHGRLLPSYALRLHFSANPSVRIYATPNAETDSHVQGQGFQSLRSGTRDMELHVNNLYSLCSRVTTCSDCALYVSHFELLNVPNAHCEVHSRSHGV